MYVRESTIVGYAYRADLWCGPCVRGELRHRHPVTLGNYLCTYDQECTLDEWVDMAASRLGVDRQDEYTFDSDDFPKIVTLGHLDFHSNEDLDECGECGERLGV